MKLPIIGGCLCGAVRYEVTELPKSAGICHCRTCQQTTGSASYPFIAVWSDALSISGEYKEYTSIGQSGKPVHRGFCAQCGSLLFGRPEAWPSIRTVAASSLDSPEEYKPLVHVWTENAQPWDYMDPELKSFARNPQK